MLHWAWEHGCEWSFLTCARAAGGGHLEVLRWAREHGCEWDGRTKDRAMRSGCAETMQYELDNGCPDEYLDDYDSDPAFDSDNEDVEVENNDDGDDGDSGDDDGPVLEMPTLAIAKRI